MSRTIKQAAAAAVAALGATGLYAANANASDAGARSAATPLATATAPAPAATAAATAKLGTVLTGKLAAKVKAAALKAVPGCTVTRVETAPNHGYAAHVVDRKGKRLVILFNHSLKVQSIKPDTVVTAPKPATSAATALAVATAPAPAATAAATAKLGTVLTGKLAAKVKAAALKAVPGCTVTRVETAPNHGYAAHVVDRKGKRLVILFNHSLKVQSIKPDTVVTAPKPAPKPTPTSSPTATIVTVRAATPTATKTTRMTPPLSKKAMAKITAAVRAKLPGSKITSMAANKGGYVAHVITPKGKHLLVKLNAKFVITSIRPE